MSIMLQIVLKDDSQAMEMLAALQTYHTVAYPVPKETESVKPSYKFKTAAVKTIYRSQ